MPTLNTVRQQIKNQLVNAGIEEADLDSRLIIVEALQLSELDFALNPEQEISRQDMNKLMPLVKMRVARKPLSQIFGSKEFWSLNFKVTPDTLTPRPDSETLIEAALNQHKNKEAELQILDLGTGTGCLLLSLLHEFPNSTGIGIDISQKAIDVAKENAETLNLKDRASFLVGDWTLPLGKDRVFDLIISNPPYIGKRERAELAPEVIDHEPEVALFSGNDGLDDYRVIAEQIAGYLKSGGSAILEIGHTQAAAVKKIFTSAGFNKVALFKDLGARDRCLIIEKQ